jgi:tetratricopeptide (TPR) repeat protein
VTGRVIHFPRMPLSSEAGEAAAERVLRTPIPERAALAEALALDDPETLLSLCSSLRRRLESSPGAVFEEAEFLYRWIEKPLRDIGLFDERDYFLGETALLAGTACRQLSRRDEAHQWFDRAESGFRHTINVVGDLSRLAYQRLAERLEERQIEFVREMLPALIDNFRKLDMHDDAVKCRFLEGLALMETDELADAVVLFQEIADEAEGLGNARLVASAYGNLTHIYGMLGETENAMTASAKAIPPLRQLNDRVGLAKVQWGLATLLRETGKLPAAIGAYRRAQYEFHAIGMRADYAALNLVVADLLLEDGREVEALRELSEALPVIMELKMAPEGVAALALVRESVRRQKVDRGALRELHGYFEHLAPTEA